MIVKITQNCRHIIPASLQHAITAFQVPVYVVNKKLAKDKCFTTTLIYLI